MRPEEEAFGELNYLKAAQEQAPFMSVPHNGGLCGPRGTRVAYTSSRTRPRAAARRAT